jgi:hypothetical protein
MDVEVIHGLPAVGFTVNHKPGSPFGAAQFDRDFPGLVEKTPHQGDIPRFRFHDVPYVFSGDHQEMYRRLGGNVVKGQDVIILKNLLAGNFARGNLTKNTITHDGQF